MKDVFTIINEMASEIRALYNITGVIDDVKKVVERMGGTVIEDTSIGAFSDGRVRKINNSSFEIAVSPFQTTKRKNFAIAYELGHLFLHMGFKTNKVKWDNQDNGAYCGVCKGVYRNESSDLEYDATTFALAFLMPRKLYKKQIDRYGNRVDTRQLAEYFHVPVSFAFIRGFSLGYFEW